MTSHGDYLGVGDAATTHQYRALGGKQLDPVVAAQLRLRWWGNFFLVVIAGLLIWNGVATSGMAVGMIQTQPQLKATTGYTAAMKKSTDDAINGTATFIQERMKQFPDNQFDVWFKEFSDSIASISTILSVVKRSAEGAGADIDKLVTSAVVASIREFVPPEDKRSVGAFLENVAALTGKIRKVADKLTPDELAQGFRTVSKLANDTATVIGAVRTALQDPNENTANV